MKRILFVVMIGCLLAAFCACQSPAGATTSAPVSTVENTPDPTLSPTPVPTTPPEATPASTRVTVMAVGDLMCLGVQLNAARSGSGYSFDYAFDQVKDILSSADLTIGNFETLISKGNPYTNAALNSSASPSASSEPSESPTQVGVAPGAVTGIAYQPGQNPQRQPLLIGPLINGPETYLSAVVDAGFDVLTNGNNHINDYGVSGIQETVAQLNAYGIAHTGAYAHASDKAPLIVEVQGIKIGIVAYADHLNREEGGDRALMDLYDGTDASEIASDIAATRAAGADFVIAYLHWGTENTHDVGDKQRTTAQYLANAGADLILGSHPHCVQGFELLNTDHGTVPVIYSLGNFVSSMPRDINKDGMIFKFALEKNNISGKTTISDLSYIPTYCGNTKAGNYVVMPADEASIAASKSPYTEALQSSRERTIAVLGSGIATPE
jgi:poly-gamma-glutamate synthesis protein (capsule biosynthesis protein)